MRIKSDQASIVDTVSLDHGGFEQLLNMPHMTHVIGEVRYQTIAPNGKVLFESEPEYNDVVLPGSMFILEKSFGIRSPLNINNINNILDINSGVVPTLADLLNEKILGFVIGIDGAGYLPGDVKAVKYASNCVMGITPFRKSTDPLAVDVAAKYLLQKQEEGTDYVYYMKKFTSPPTMKHLFIDGTEVQPSVMEATNPMGIRSFVECICDIDKDDIREYFNINDGNLIRARLNSMGLVAGFMSGGEIANARLTTLLNFRNVELDNIENTVRFIYRFYCM